MKLDVSQRPDSWRLACQATVGDGTNGGKVIYLSDCLSISTSLSSYLSSRLSIYLSIHPSISIYIYIYIICIIAVLFHVSVLSNYLHEVQYGDC